VTVPGLTNGISYTFTVRASNAVGSGPPSDPSEGIVPDLVEPDEPGDVVAAVGDGAAIVMWGPPESDGGSLVTGYLVTTYPERGEVRVGPDATSASVDRLVNGTAYRFLVRAVNDVGTGPAATSAEVVPAAEPDAPNDVTVELLDTGVTVSWNPPDWDGGSPIIAYTVTASPAGLQVTVDGDTTSVTLTGLLSGSMSGRIIGLIYNFTVSASNAVATSAPSPPALELLLEEDCDEVCDEQDDDDPVAPDPMAIVPIPVRL
jgi:CO/xanthine dehydrogenase Mo-binding subunit